MADVDRSDYAIEFVLDHLSKTKKPAVGAALSVGALSVPGTTFRVKEWKANKAATGYANNDLISHYQPVLADGTLGTAFYVNHTAGTVLAATPPAADLVAVATDASIATTFSVENWQANKAVGVTIANGDFLDLYQPVLANGTVGTAFWVNRTKGEALATAPALADRNPVANAADVELRSLEWRATVAHADATPQWLVGHLITQTRVIGADGTTTATTWYNESTRTAITVAPPIASLAQNSSATSTIEPTDWWATAAHVDATPQWLVGHLIRQIDVINPDGTVASRSFANVTTRTAITVVPPVGDLSPNQGEMFVTRDITLAAGSTAPLIDEIATGWTSYTVRKISGSHVVHVDGYAIDANGAIGKLDGGRVSRTAVPIVVGVGVAAATTAATIIRVTRFAIQ